MRTRHSAFSGHGMGGDGSSMMRGRKFGADELQLMLLALLEEQARHGYELIKELEARSNGFYSPSPGVIYPALTYLEELDYTTVEVHGNRKRYHLAAPGKVHLDTHRERVELLFAGLQHAARKMAWMKQAWQGQAGVQEAEQASGWLHELVEARRALREALLRRTDADAAEQRRLAAILRRAVAEITGKRPAPCDPA
ncbi:MAG TPA: PadR family transcriptional regulator [Bordetella sp.]|nr:PadR family transcriptional regulator [Bordetella sp.]